MSDALFLADKLEAEEWHDAAAELRRLHAENEALRADNKALGDANEQLDVECARLEALNAELVEALQKFSGLYGRLWDSADTKGAGFLTPDSVKAYDDVHELVGELLRKVEAGK